MRATTPDLDALDRPVTPGDDRPGRSTRSTGAAAALGESRLPDSTAVASQGQPSKVRVDRRQPRQVGGEVPQVHLVDLVVGPEVQRAGETVR